SSRAAEPVPSIKRTCVRAITGASTLTNLRTSGDSVCAARNDEKQKNRMQNLGKIASVSLDEKGKSGETAATSQRFGQTPRSGSCGEHANLFAKDHAMHG